MRPQHYYDWHEIVDEQAPEPVAVTRDRARWILGLFALALCAIFGRAVVLEITDGDRFRRLAAQPIEREVALPARRGRILLADGTVLAADRQATALAVQFRYLQSPPDAAWLRRRARARLSPAQRRHSEQVAAIESQLRVELAEMHRRLARLCNVSEAQWQARTASIDRRTSALASRVNRRRLEQHGRQDADTTTGQEASAVDILSGLFAPPETLPPPEVIIVEQTAYHRIVDDVPADVAAEIHRHPRDYPGVKVIEHVRRDYPAGTLAAHVVGHVGRAAGLDSQVATSDASPDAGETIGLMGIERRLDGRLRGQPGLAAESTDHRGRVLATRVTREPIAGHDVVLTIDPRLQHSAEMWLDHQTRSRRRKHSDDPTDATHGGAVVVMDVHTGELVAVASAPRFDPNLLVAGDLRVEAVLDDPARPLFDRAAKMALPPGSVFKSLTALALASEQAIDPHAVFSCQGYLDDPQRLRCRIFRDQGIGHGDVTLRGALAQSCNVYFFHHVDAIGGVRLVNWAARFGFGQPTGVELPDEASGELPTADWLRRQSGAQLVAVGQGAVTATPLQVARLYAAIANGGYLVTPRITRDQPAMSERSPARHASRPSESVRIHGLTSEALEAVRAGLRATVDDPNGTAFNTVHLSDTPIAGKTGTAETGNKQQDHAWFAGYVPADAPRYAFVVVLEHAGSGADVAGPIARNLVQRMRELGYFDTSETADKAFPPGKG